MLQSDLKGPAKSLLVLSCAESVPDFVSPAAILNYFPAQESCRGEDSMRGYLVVLGLCSVLALAPTIVDAQGNNCSFPGKGVGVGGTPGKGGTPGTFPGGGATGGVFPGGNCVSSTPGGTVSASEPLTLGLTGLALIGASMLRRRRE